MPHCRRPSVAIEQKTPADDLIEAGSAKGPPPVLPPKPSRVMSRPINPGTPEATVPEKTPTKDQPHPLPSAPESSASSRAAASPLASSPAAAPPPPSRLRSQSLRKLARAVRPPPEFATRRHPGGAESVRETGVVVGLQGGTALVSWSGRPKKVVQHNSEQLEPATGSTGHNLKP